MAGFCEYDNEPYLSVSSGSCLATLGTVTLKSGFIYMQLGCSFWDVMRVFWYACVDLSVDFSVSFCRVEELY